LFDCIPIDGTGTAFVGFSFVLLEATMYPDAGAMGEAIPCNVGRVAAAGETGEAIPCILGVMTCVVFIGATTDAPRTCGIGPLEACMSGGPALEKSLKTCDACVCEVPAAMTTCEPPAGAICAELLAAGTLWEPPGRRWDPKATGAVTEALAGAFGVMGEAIPDIPDCVKGPIKDPVPTW
jgi:hypothetical protein